MRLHLSIAFLLCSAFTFGQSIPNNQVSWNRIFAKHYSNTQLGDIKEHSAEIYAAINYYFIESFDVKISGCETCAVDKDRLFNFDIFDVYEHESMRLDDTNFSFEYKSYTVTLHPKSEVYAHLEGMLPTSLVNYIAPRNFPVFELTNDDYAQYLEYKQQVYTWAKDFPEQYRTMTNAESLLKISIKEFSELPEEKKISFLSHPAGYLIIN